jgi:integrase
MAQSGHISTREWPSPPVGLSRVARPATGQVVERSAAGGRTFAIRFRAYGDRHYVTLGKERDGWTRGKAEVELANVLADVRRGLWKPPEPEPEPKKPRSEPAFHEFASEWLERRRVELRPKTVANYRWALVDHLLPFFAGHSLSAITAEEVDRYKTAKLREGRLAPNQVNTTLTRLAQVLEDAVEYGHIASNAARGRRRRVKASKPRRTWVEPEQLPSLIAAADRRHRSLVATLAGAGLRIGEACALNWSDVNLHTGALTVRAAKTEAGEDRCVDLPLGVREELMTLKARGEFTDRTDPVFTTRRTNGIVRRQTPSNVGRRLKTTIRRANKRLGTLGIEPISERVTPHSLRRTYASLRFALGDDPVYVASQLGHTEATFSMEVYAKAVKRRERLSGTYLPEFDSALEWARLGTNPDHRGGAPASSQLSRIAETA